MISQNFRPFVFAQNFLGVNTKDTNENMLDGEWHEESKNIFSDPQGALASRPGFTAIASSSASIGSATAWIGFYQLRRHISGSSTNYYIGGGSNGKLYEFSAGSYVEIGTGLSVTKDIHLSFLTVNNTALILADGNLPRSWAGTGSVATFATSVTADFGVEWQRRAFLHSTVDKRIVYYSGLDSPTGAYTSFLNFDLDPEAVTGLSKQGDDLLVGKEHNLYRVQYRGTDPLFTIYKLQANMGPVCHWVMKELPDGRVVYLAPDYNFWMAEGDSIIEAGDNIKKYVRDCVKSRLRYAVSGVNYRRDQYWCSFTKTTGATANDVTVVMDYQRPYSDRWGKTQYPWFIYTIGANCFSEVYDGGEAWLYHGGYTGKMFKNDSGTNDDGSAFISHYRSKSSSFGDPTLEKKFDNVELSFDRSGNWGLGISFVVDQNAGTQKVITQNLLAGVSGGALFDVAMFDVDYFSVLTDAYTRRHIDRQGKEIYTTFGTSGLDEFWAIDKYVIHAKPLRRRLVTRESA